MSDDSDTDAADSDDRTLHPDDGSNPDELPPLVWDREGNLRDRLADADGLLLCSDFDGTLTEIVDDPDAPEISDANLRNLRRLRDRTNVRVALVSGRELDDLCDRVGMDDVVYAGNHGLELFRDGETVVHPIAAKRKSQLARIADDLQETFADSEGIAVENKGVTLTVHYRQAPDGVADEVRETVEDAVDRVAGDSIRVETGKEIVELAPAVPWDKGRLVSLLAEDIPDSWARMYIGDDTTDEHAFRSFDPTGVTIHVGENPKTSAHMRLRDPDDVADFLELLDDIVAGQYGDDGTSA